MEPAPDQRRGLGQPDGAALRLTGSASSTTIWTTCETPPAADGRLCRSGGRLRLGRLSRRRSGRRQIAPWQQDFLRQRHGDDCHARLGRGEDACWNGWRTGRSGGSSTASRQRSRYIYYVGPNSSAWYRSLGGTGSRQRHQRCPADRRRLLGAARTADAGDRLQRDRLAACARHLYTTIKGKNAPGTSAAELPG